MKQNIFMSLAILSSMAIGMTGCSEDDLISQESTANVKEGKGITIKASVDESSLRVAFKDEEVDGVTKQIMYWKNVAGAEQFSLHYTGEDTDNYLFVKTETTTDAKSADFTCATTPSVSEGTTVYAVYPGVNTNVANATTISFSLQNQPGTEAIIDTTTANVGDYNFMVAETTVPAGGLETAFLHFVHKVALVKMELTFPDDVTGNITNISINSASMHNQGTYTLSTGAWSYDDAQKGSVSTSSSATFALTDDHKVTAWLAVFPEVLTGITITATANLGRDNYTVSMSDVTFDASKVYTVTDKTMTKITNFKSAYLDSDFKYWDATVSSGCPTPSQIVAYIKAGVYFDDNTTVTDGQQTYTTCGSTYHTGLWVKKKNLIENFYTETDKTIEKDFTRLSAQDADFVKTIRTGGDYFFLPAAGYNNGRSAEDLGANGLYMSNEYIYVDCDGNYPFYVLGFSEYSGKVYLGTKLLWNFMTLPWVAE